MQANKVLQTASGSSAIIPKRRSKKTNADILLEYFANREGARKKENEARRVELLKKLSDFARYLGVKNPFLKEEDFDSQFNRCTELPPFNENTTFRWYARSRIY